MTHNLGLVVRFLNELIDSAPDKSRDDQCGHGSTKLDLQSWIYIRPELACPRAPIAMKTDC